MADDVKNNVEEKLKPTNGFATAFTKITSVALGVVAAAGIAIGISNMRDGGGMGVAFGALFSALGIASGIASVTAWDSASGASRARNFTEKVSDNLAVNAALGRS